VNEDEVLQTTQDTTQNEAAEQSAASTSATPTKTRTVGGTLTYEITPGYGTVDASDADNAAASAANTRSYADLINQQYQAYNQRQAAATDYATQQNINAAARTYEEAVPEYQRQYQTQTVNMLQGADNAALNARAGGEFGGMATLRTNTVQSAYQQQRQQLALQQQKLAADTIRQISSLRAQGEFDKADQLLRSRQREFQALYEDAIRVDENQWANEQYDITNAREDEGIDRNEESIQRQKAQDDKQYLQSLGKTFLDAGVMPSDVMLSAMGLDQSTAQLYINAVLMGL